MRGNICEEGFFENGGNSGMFESIGKGALEKRVIMWWREQVTLGRNGSQK